LCSLTKNGQATGSVDGYRWELANKSRFLRGSTDGAKTIGQRIHLVDD